MSLPKCTLSVDNASVLRADGRECVRARARVSACVCVCVDMGELVLESVSAHTEM